MRATFSLFQIFRLKRPQQALKKDIDPVLSGLLVKIELITHGILTGHDLVALNFSEAITKFLFIKPTIFV